MLNRYASASLESFEVEQELLSSWTVLHHCKSKPRAPANTSLPVIDPKPYLLSEEAVLFHRQCSMGLTCPCCKGPRIYLCSFYFVSAWMGENLEAWESWIIRSVCHSSRFSDLAHCVANDGKQVAVGLSWADLPLFLLGYTAVWQALQQGQYIVTSLFLTVHAALVFPYSPAISMAQQCQAVVCHWPQTSSWCL